MYAYDHVYSHKNGRIRDKTKTDNRHKDTQMQRLQPTECKTEHKNTSYIKPALIE